MCNNFKILSKNNTDELIFYKMLERKKKWKKKIQYIYLVKKRKILHNQLTVQFFNT